MSVIPVPTVADLEKKLEEAKLRYAEERMTSKHACPHCGYCPHCGRGANPYGPDRLAPLYPSPYYYPYLGYRPMGITWVKD